MPHFGDMEVSRITKAEVDKWYATASKQYKPGAFEHACNTLKRVLTAASKPQDDDSPALLAANPCNFPTLRKPSARRNQTPLTKDEIDRLVTLFPEYYQLCIRLSLLVGGLRIGEICGLQLRDIDLDHGLLYVRHSVDRGPADLGSYQLADVKAPRSNRVVPIPASAVAMIREHIEKFCPDREPGTMLFHSIRDASKLLGPTTIQRQFRTARKKIGRPDITFHSLRSTHATMFMLEGGTLRETMDKLGHVDVDVAINCYQRIVPRHQREVAELLAYHYMSSDDPPPCAPKSTNENRNSPTSRTTSPNSGSGSRPVWRRTGHEVQQSSKPCSPQSRSGSGSPAGSRPCHAGLGFSAPSSQTTCPTVPPVTRITRTRLRSISERRNLCDASSTHRRDTSSPCASFAATRAASSLILAFSPGGNRNSLMPPTIDCA